LPPNLWRRASASKARPAVSPTAPRASPPWGLLPAASGRLVAMEATGGYEQQAFAQLSEQGLPVAILNPRAVRQFAQSMGSLEKTDRIDAGMIAWYAEVKKSQPTCLAPQSQQHLRALVTRLRQLTEIRTRPAQSTAAGHRSRRAGFVQEASGRAGAPNPRTRTAYRRAGRPRSAVARAQSDLPQHQGRGRPHRSAANGGDAGDRRVVQQDHLQAGWGRPAGPRLGQTPGQAYRAWRTRSGPRNPVHRGQRGGPLRA
jgi:hypothetical protein